MRTLRADQRSQQAQETAQPDKAPFSDGSGEAVELFVHSGKCCLCQIGISTGAFDFKGREIHTGDIVSLYRAEPGEDGPIELFTPLTVVIADQFQSFSDGSVRLVERPMQFFSMGIKNVGISSPEWPVAIVKKYHDVVEGEHWPAWGFSYSQNEAAATLSPRSARHG